MALFFNDGVDDKTPPSLETRGLLGRWHSDLYLFDTSPLEFSAMPTIDRDILILTGDTHVGLQGISFIEQEC